MKKRLLILLISFCTALTAVCGCKLFGEKDSTVTVKHDVIGCGGYGAVFNAQIDPFDQNTFGATCDMGSIYFTHDKGESWIRHNVDGTVYALRFDPTNEGVVYAAGSGIFKSTNHGRTMRRIFPKQEQITSEGNNYENANYWIYTDKQSDYAPHYQIWSLAIDRKSGGKNVFAAQRVASDGMGYKKSIRIYRATDGENFSLFTELDYSYNFKIDYDEVNDCLIVVTPQKIVEINSHGEIEFTYEAPVVVQFSNGNNIAFNSSYDKSANKNTFVFSLSGEGEHYKNICYKTNNLRDESSFINLTAPLLQLTTDDFGVPNIPNYNSGRPSYEYCEWIGGKTVPQQFKWTINDVYSLNDDVIYLFHEANTDTFDENGKLYVNRRTIIYLKYDGRKEAGKRYSWVFGNPLKTYTESIRNTTWQDSDSDFCFGMSSSPQNENAFLYCSNVGLYYTPDGDKVTQLNSKFFGKDKLTFINSKGETAEKEVQRVVTTGVDVICTQVVVTDPFDENHVLMGCTDIGLLQSYDNCQSWYHSLNAWQNGSLKNIAYEQYTNTCFDLHFDRERRGVVYGIWSQIKTAPYATNENYLKSISRFGISYDGGLSWEMNEILQGGCLPYRMQVIYEGNERVFYLTTDGNGFFVGRDLGKTFTPMNDGIEPVTAYGKSVIWGNEILVCKMGTFAITGGNASDSNGQAFYKWNESLNKFEKIELPKVAVGDKSFAPAAVRDIEYDEKHDCLYLACTANVVHNGSKLEKTSGGILKYKDGEFTQIYDETKSVFCVKTDGSGRLYAAELGNKVLRFNADNTACDVLIDGLFHRLKNINFGPNDNIIYIPTWGGSTERLILTTR